MFVYTEVHLQNDEVENVEKVRQLGVLDESPFEVFIVHMKRTEGRTSQPGVYGNIYTIEVMDVSSAETVTKCKQNIEAGNFATAAETGNLTGLERKIASWWVQK